jgi:cell division septal protein FtsQ
VFANRQPFNGKEFSEQGVIIKKSVRKENKRASTSRQRKRQHLLDVKVRAKKAASQRTQKAFFTVCGLVLLAAVCGGIAFGAKRILNTLFFANSDYSLKTIEVTTDGNLNRETILHAADISEDENLFSIDLPKVREKLGALPQVEECRIQRILPGKIVISIQERRPVAWVVPPDANTGSFNFEDAYLVDRRGILLKPKSLAPEYLGLPLIIGVATSNCQAGQPLEQDEVKSALDLIRASSEILQARFQIQSIDVSKQYCLQVTDKQRASVTFGIDEIEWQLHRLETVLNYCDKNNRELQTVNLMAQRNVPVTFVPQAQPTAPLEPDNGSDSTRALAPDAKTKNSTGQLKQVEPAHPKKNSFPNLLKSQEKKTQQKPDKNGLKPFKEGVIARPPGRVEETSSSIAARINLGTNTSIEWPETIYS